MTICGGGAKICIVYSAQKISVMGLQGGEKSLMICTDVLTCQSVIM